MSVIAEKSISVMQYVAAHNKVADRTPWNKPGPNIDRSATSLNIILSPAPSTTPDMAEAIHSLPPASPVQRLVLELAQFIDDWLYAQHEKLVAQVEPELEALLAGTVAEHGVDERHDGRLQTDIIGVCARRPVQVVDDALRKSTNVSVTWIKCF